jgi:hypothetical protein
MSKQFKGDLKINKFLKIQTKDLRSNTRKIIFNQNLTFETASMSIIVRFRIQV